MLLALRSPELGEKWMKIRKSTAEVGKRIPSDLSN